MEFLSRDNSLIQGDDLLFAHYSLGATNVTYQQHKTGREERASVLGKYEGFRGCTIWEPG
ncbi:unnamed protein product [Strongylus vulgaris]|uniref:Uncharacterized protein n=1 Tax=Strongylus vulgaris TaxID=40348 RepID=A0A3P7J5U3_STRVU|nr:unnamed protein product [Strongylus vulgaris]